jgi:hypothetical protein
MAAAGPVVFYAGEKETAARRLHDALAAAGYPASLIRLGSGGLEGMATSEAAIVIWSKALMDSVPAVALLDAARQRGTLIEASADGIAPIPSLDANRVALLSGWRGEPHHPGWQRIVAELKALGASPAGAAPRARSAPSAAGASPAAAARAPRAPLRATMAAALGAVLLLVMGVAAAAWIGRSGPPLEPQGAIASAAPLPAEPDTIDHVPPASDAPVEEPVQCAAALPLPDPVSETASPAAEPAQRPVAAPVRSGAARTAEARAEAPRRVAASPDRSVRNMRLFCERSGRSTPQCRRFRRSAAVASAVPAPSRREARAPVRYRNSGTMRRFCDGAGRGTAECRLFQSRTAGR